MQLKTNLADGQQSDMFDFQTGSLSNIATNIESRIAQWRTDNPGREVVDFRLMQVSEAISPNRFLVQVISRPKR